MRLWHLGCGLMLLGVVLTLGSCGLFGLAINRQLEQRQIVTTALSVGRSPATASFEMDEDSRLRLRLEAALRPSGEDFAADMAKMAADPTTQEWWELTNPCQEPPPTRKEGEWWAEMEEVFHLD